MLYNISLFISSHRLFTIYQHTRLIITHTLIISPPLHPSTTHQSTAVQGRLAYRRAIVQRLIPALRAFSPGLILISAGFDGAQGKILPCSFLIFTPFLSFIRSCFFRCCYLFFSIFLYYVLIYFSLSLHYFIPSSLFYAFSLLCLFTTSNP